MNSLVRTAVLVAATATLALGAGCGGTEATPIILPFSNICVPGGTTLQNFPVVLNMKVTAKTYVDITPNPGDEALVSTAWNGTASTYIIFGAGTNTQTVDIKAEAVTNPAHVTLTFKIRDTKEYQALSIDIKKGC